eukprot:1245929-Pleurochrysis_carterae.AAC.1
MRARRNRERAPMHPWRAWEFDPHAVGRVGWLRCCCSHCFAWIVCGEGVPVWIRGIVVKLRAPGVTWRRVEQGLDCGIIGVDVIAGVKCMVRVRGLTNASHARCSFALPLAVHDSDGGQRGRSVDRVRCTRQIRSFVGARVGLGARFRVRGVKTQRSARSIQGE